ncbi:hypothetical protein [Streptomyces wuyuanensis]|uniref:Uncharacterized protein n=1 Tax=Streptomyces wuyuanensis TaxID=1196353 RepID=A0A1G9YCV7_9ACTN|nr:hypothetical protein [Streptomyces wuyuanensis]SDN06466.1 hypothetical protein SAMN05444921_11853 [Streptomyces wuyuanensis]
MVAITKENDQSHRPHGRTIGSITVVQYIAWQGMRRQLGLPLADVRRQELFFNTEQRLTVHWRTRFPCYPAGTCQVPSADPHTVGRTDHFGRGGIA